ncbi:MAG: 4-(cytidine 5'-diphospho)-2-C-methyl-D-erythritol kinase [Firmicutes bacterium]|nr:4-(cytidine 5'-diphospho)-2-C-methyl-D-erythritol kinase [Bacillota bacterium]
MEQITLQAYAKVNLTLDIQGRRKDGYHLLRSVMQSISLADTITLQKKGRGQGISLHSDHPSVPDDEHNICWRAAQAFEQHTQLSGGVAVSISLAKKIPVAAGLGGGSADAAAVLYGLNKLYGTGLELAKLQQIGLTIGADVPFCLQGGTCLVEGIGEAIRPVGPFPSVTMVLVKPKAGVSTAQIYRGLDPATYGGDSTDRLLEFMTNRTDTPLASILENALESVTSVLVPEVGIWKGRLLEHGALVSLMSGSGPTVFGLFSEELPAQRFLERFQHEVQVFGVTLMDRGVCSR